MRSKSSTRWKISLGVIAFLLFSYTHALAGEFLGSGFSGSGRYEVGPSPRPPIPPWPPRPPSPGPRPIPLFPSLPENALLSASDVTAETALSIHL